MATKVPIEDRLKQMSNETEIPSTSGVSESYSALLAQGLRSGDKKILDKVLHNSDETAIAATAKQLNVQNLVPLLKELKERIISRTDIHAYVKWLRYVVVYHNSYLTSNSGIMEELKEHYEVFNKRNQLLPKMLELQGKINFLIGKMDEVNSTTFSKQPPLASYQETSSDTDSELEEQQRKSELDEDEWLDMIDKNDVNDNDQEEKLMNGEVSGGESEKDDNDDAMEDDGDDDGDEDENEEEESNNDENSSDMES